MIGIYKINSIIDNKIYIGQSKNIKNRFKEHSRKLKSNTHYNRHLQFAYNKYGKDNFTFDILKLCNIEDLNNLEKDFIEIYDTLNDIRKGRISKPVFGFNENGILLKQWSSIKECARDLEVSPCDIRRVIRLEAIHCKGYRLNNENIFKTRDSLRGLNLKKMVTF